MPHLKQVKDILIKGIGKDFPGASFGMVFPDGHIETDFVGFKQLIPTKEVCNGNEIYDIASLTKVVSTTTMIMKLIEDHRLALDDNISDYVPLFKRHDITIEDVLIHASGLPADISRARYLSNRQDVLYRVFDMALQYQTKTKIVYSDVGFILLGLVIENITGMSLDEAAKHMIFDPLHMKDTSYKPDISRAAPTEIRSDNVCQELLIGKVHDEKSFAMNGLAGHAGLFSTSYDLCLFIKDILLDHKVLNEQTINAMFIPRMTYQSDDGTLLIRSYGWDKNGAGGILGHLERRDGIIGHTGFTGCHMIIDKTNQFGFVLLSNAVHPKRELNHIFAYRKEIADAILKS